MKRMLLLVGLGAFLAWRRARFDRLDREHGFGSYAPVVPEARA